MVLTGGCLRLWTVCSRPYRCRFQCLTFHLKERAAIHKRKKIFNHYKFALHHFTQYIILDSADLEYAADQALNLLRRGDFVFLRVFDRTMHLANRDECISTNGELFLKAQQKLR